MLLHSSSGCRSARSIDLDQRKLVNPLLGVLAILGLLMTGNSTVQAQCPAPWFGAAIYGTMILQTNATTSDGLGGTANTIENDLVSFKMANPVPCAWSTANFGAMGGLLILNDTDLNPLPPQCLDRSYIGSGPPVGPEQYVSMEQPGTFPKLVSVSAECLCKCNTHAERNLRRRNQQHSNYRWMGTEPRVRPRCRCASTYLSTCFGGDDGGFGSSKLERTRTTD